MSDPFVPPAPVPPPYGTQVPPRRRSRLPLAIGLVLLVLGLAGGSFVAVKVLGADDKKDAPRSAEKEITFPEKWDERILPYTEIAAEERDLDFEHPVEVRFLSDADFEKDFRADEEELSESDKKEIEQFTGMLRAVGMISGDVDLYQAFSDFHSSGTLAYYSTEDKRITVRGTKITPAMKSTLVHELVHVLQDQNFDIGTRTDEFTRDAEDGDTEDNEATVFDAIVEGDASRIETQYRESLSRSEQRQLDASENEQNEEAGAAYKKLPKIVVTLETAPYALGEAVVAAVAEDGGNDAVDDLFTNTPKHEAALLDAFEVLTSDTDADEVDVPELDEGEEKFASGEFGSLTLFFMLAERLPLKDALAAADGWDGDKYVAYTSGDTSCVQIALAGDSDDARDRLETSLRAWANKTPGSAISVERDEDLVRFRSCDPGTEGPAGNDASQDALTLVTARTYLGVTLMKQGAPPGRAACLSDSLLREFTVAQLNDETLADDPAVKAKIQRLAATCA